MSNICVFSQDTSQRWKDVCEGAPAAHCDNIGKVAYSNESNPITMRDLRVGTIVGVAWMEKGSTVSPSGSQLILAPGNAYYYIIDDGASDSFLRECEEIDAK